MSRFKAPPRLSLSEWADTFARLSSEDSAEPGPWRTSRAEFQRGIMDACSDSDIEYVVIMASAQVGKTALLRNIIGYYAHQDPSPMLMVQPTIDMAEVFSKDRLSVFIRDTPALTEVFGDPKARDSGNTLRHKQFPGGFIALSGANSPASLASRPVRVVLFDEVDRFPFSAGTEGDPMSLGKKRADTFWNRKYIAVSTPTISGVSRIEREFEKSDKRHYYVACPDCGHEQTLKFGNLKWDAGKPETAVYACDGCGVVWTEKDKHHLIRKGRWIASNPESKIAGFHINALYSPWRKWSEVAAAFLEAKGNVETLKTFINTYLGEPFEDRGEAPDYMHIYARRENYPRGSVPEGVVFLTAGADVQKDRIEVEVRGWGRSESWSIDYYIFMGDTADQKVFENLDALLQRTWEHPSGAELSVRALGIDTGGATTQSVYYWCRRQQPERVYALKGMTTEHAVTTPKAVDIDYRGQKISNGLKLWGVGVSSLKSELYAKLRLQPNGKAYPAGYIHFPDYDEEYFRQLTAESMVAKYAAGRVQMYWRKVYERNEALDIAVYNRAVAVILGIDRLTDNQWAEAERSLIKQQTQTATLQRPMRRVINRGIRSEI